ncbi:MULTISPECIES: PAAR domain-containing protein [Cupriavidus]
MTDIRYPLRNGDRTSTNGTLVATGRSWFHYDVVVGVEGDYATCPACNAGGPVMNDCSHQVEIDGKRILVSGARVHCQCATKPTILPSKTDFAVEVYAPIVPLAPTPVEPAGWSQVVAAEDGEIIEQYFEITTDTGLPAEGYHYDLFRNDQLIARNRVATDGRTLPVMEGCSLRIVMWLDKRGQECA